MAKMELDGRAQRCPITEASLTAATLTEHAGRREVMRGWNRAGVKEVYVRLENE